MLKPEEIKAGRHYLCRVETLDGWELTVGCRPREGSRLIRGPGWQNSIGAESCQVLRELDLEALERNSRMCAWLALAEWARRKHDASR